jgi:hypothetical protein
MPNRRERRATPVSLAPLIGLTILAAGLAFAQQNLPVPPTPAPTEPAATAPAAGAEAARDSDAAAGKSGDGAPAAKPAAAKGSPQRFEPTERVRPDFDVAFPVDI